MRRFAVMLGLLLVAGLESRAATPHSRPDKPALPVGAVPKVTAPQKAKPLQAPDPEVNLDFDLLDTPKTSLPVAATQPAIDLDAVRRRRTMLTLHQAVGIALVAGEAGSVITGQLNYNDKFLGENSGRFQTLHKAFVYPTLGLAALTAGLAIFAPVPKVSTGHGFDRMVLHRIGQYTAFAGWAAELVLGLLATFHEGFANQPAFAAAHQGVGYVTLAGLSLGVAAITF